MPDVVINIHRSYSEIAMYSIIFTFSSLTGSQNGIDIIIIINDNTGNHCIFTMTMIEETIYHHNVNIL
mgnify:CR=1 FL=1